MPNGHGPRDQQRSEHRSQQNQRNQGYQQNISLPEPNAFSFFTDKEKKILNTKYIDEKAIEWAQSFKSLKSSQMRRFYDELKAIERSVMRGDDFKKNFQSKLPLLILFKAKAVYSEKRKVSPREFTQFIFDNIASIKDLDDFKAFIKVFESVVAFHKYFSEDR
jgi:CRISPR-associated protein Csm2